MKQRPNQVMTRLGKRAFQSAAVTILILAAIDLAPKDEPAASLIKNLLRVILVTVAAITMHDAYRAYGIIAQSDKKATQPKIELDRKTATVNTEYDEEPKTVRPNAKSDKEFKKYIKGQKLLCEQWEKEIIAQKKYITDFDSNNVALSPIMQEIEEEITTFLATVNLLKAKLSEKKDYKFEWIITERQKEFDKIKELLKRLTQKAIDQEKIAKVQTKMLDILKNLYDLNFPKATDKFIETPITLTIVDRLQHAIFKSSLDIRKANGCRTELIKQIQGLNGLKQRLAKVMKSIDPSASEINAINLELQQYEGYAAKKVMQDANAELTTILSSDKKEKRTAGYFDKSAHSEKQKQPKPLTTTIPAEPSGNTNSKR